jgi:prepilin-type N-terminal cleavage/methylation domain-containing protein
MKKILSRGFTLVELLIVVTLIGILAVAALAAINPIEQVNKTRDAQRKADANQLLAAIERYYASTLSYPWGDENSSLFAPVNDVNIGVCGDDTCASDGKLITAQELKTQFRQRSQFTTASSDPSENMYIYAGNGSMAVCFVPSSKATRTENYANLKYFDLSVAAVGEFSSSTGTAVANPIISGCAAEGDPLGGGNTGVSYTSTNVEDKCYVCVPEE